MTCWLLPPDRDVAAIIGRHVEPCAKTWLDELAGRCLGCYPCDTPAARHCQICHTHLDPTTLGTCALCRGATRRALADLLELYAQLPTQALNGGHNGHLAASDEIPGADAAVHLAAGSPGYLDDSRTDDLPASYVLAYWEQIWREARHETTQQPTPPGYIRAADLTPSPAAILVQAHRYLTVHLDWAASRHPAFYVFRRDLVHTRAQLEAVLYAGERPDSGVPCFVCGATLERSYRDPTPCDCGPRPRPAHDHGDDRCCLGCRALENWVERHAGHDQGGLQATDPYDGWACPRCRRAYNPGEYQRAVSVLHADHARVLPAQELAERLDIQPATIWQWAARGHVRRRGRATDGRTLYDVADAVRHANTASAVLDTAPGQGLS